MSSAIAPRIRAASPGVSETSSAVGSPSTVRTASMMRSSRRASASGRSRPTAGVTPVASRCA